MSTVIVKKRSRFVAVQVLDTQVVADLSRETRKLSGCSQACVGGTGDKAIRHLLGNDLQTYPTIKALREDHPGAVRAPEHDRY